MDEESEMMLASYDSIALEEENFWNSMLDKAYDEAYQAEVEAYEAIEGYADYATGKAKR